VNSSIRKRPTFDLAESGGSMLLHTPDAE